MKIKISVSSILFLLFLSQKILAQQSIQTKVNRVIVFSQGAQIERVKQVQLKEGENTIQFIDLENAINAKTIQIIGSDRITIVSTDYKTKERDENFLSNEILDLKDSIKTLDRIISLKRSRRANYVNEKNMILSNKTVGGESGFDIEDLMELSEYYRNKLNSLDELIYDTDIDTKLLNKSRRTLNNQLTQKGFSSNMGVVEVKIIAQNTTSVNLKLTYITNNVSWTPFYDIKSDGIEMPLEVKLKGSINQNTGVNWNNVNLVLSTSTPLSYGVIPDVHPWTLYFKNTYKNKGYKKRSYSNQYQVQSNASYGISSTAGALEQSVTLADFTKTTENMTNREYYVSIPYSIKGYNGKAIVELDKYKMESDYVYYTAPKFDKNVYLLANVSEWEQHNLLPGSANIFLKGTYVGSSFIDPTDISDTLSLLLGKDQDIVADRKKIKDYCKKAVFGGSKTTELGLEVIIKNKKNKDIKILVEDQVPISKSEEIEVKIVDKSKAKHNIETGKLKWEYTLKSGESRKHNIRYQVKYPKKKVIGNL